jgi:hypothetical protein
LQTTWSEQSIIEERQCRQQGGEGRGQNNLSSYHSMEPRATTRRCQNNPSSYNSMKAKAKTGRGQNNPSSYHSMEPRATTG